MPLVDLKCTNDDCQHQWEFYRALAHWDDPLPPCEKCQSPSFQSLDQSYRTHHQPPDAVVVYQAPDGTFRFPGDTQSSTTAKYDRQGFTRIELRSAVDVRRFESVMNKHEYARAERRIERAQAMRAQREHANRADLRMKMQSMSRFGRDVARTAMFRNDAKPGLRAQDAGFHVDAYSNDRSNRDESRDAQGRRRRD